MRTRNLQHVGATGTSCATAGARAFKTATIYCCQSGGELSAGWAVHPYNLVSLQVVVVGLDWVTEFQKEGERSFYHCSLQPCKNEQGNSRCV